MAIIPRFTSRVLPPGAQPGAIKTAQLRGKVGAGLAAALGDTIIAGVNFKKRKDAEDDAEQARRAAILEELGRATEDLGKSLENLPALGESGAPTTAGGIPLEFGESASAAGAAGDKATAAVSNLTARTDQQKQVGATLDSQSDVNWLASFEQSITRTRAAAQATAAAQGGPAKGMALRALAVFDREVARLSKALEDRPHLKDKFGALVASSRAPMELRLLTQENTLRVVENKAQLFDSLGGLALAAGQDPAMVSGVTGRGFGQIESAMNSGLLTPEEAAAMQQDFGFRVHMSAVRGQIAADPVDAQNRLVAGEFDEFFDDATLSRLSRDAGSAVRVRAAAASQAERAQKRELAFDTTEHLAALAETGVGDAGLDARARSALPPEDYATFQASETQARERHATRQEYTFMTEEEIEADIAAQAPGPGPRDTDKREAAHAMRLATRDEVLAARAADPAGWAMRDDEVAAVFAAARENPDDPVLAGKAIQQRLALQREMGIGQPRLLSEAEKEAVAEELQSLPPVERLARLGELKRLYGDRFDQLRQELGSDIDGATARLALFAGRPQLAALLAAGIGKAQRNGLAKSDGTLPPAVFIYPDADGSRKFDLGKLGTEYGIGQIFILPDGSRVLYDGDALVPTNADIPVTLAGPTAQSAPKDPANPATPIPPIPLGGGAGQAPAGGDLEAEHVTLPSASEEGDGGSAEEAGGQGPGGGASAGPNEAHDFHPETERLDTEQPTVATDRQPSLQDGESSGRPVSEPHSAPDANSDTNEKRVEGSHDREPENPSPSVDNTKKEPAVEWALVTRFVTSKETFKTNGPVKIELNSMTLGLDGLRYTVDWHPLDKNGNRATAVQSEDYRPPEYGGHVLPGVPSETVIEPPYDNPYGFMVTVKVPPQERYNDNSSGPYLNIYQSK